MGCVKIKNKCLTRIHFGAPKIIFFLQITKNIMLSQKFVCGHRICAFAARKKIQIFLAFFNRFFK
jgi:hypothetical protein